MRAVLNDDAVREDDDAVGVARLLDFVRGEEDGALPRRARDRRLDELR